MQITRLDSNNLLGLQDDATCPSNLQTKPLWHTIFKVLNTLFAGCFFKDYGIGVKVTDQQGNLCQVYLCEEKLRQWIGENLQMEDLERLQLQFKELTRTALKIVLRSLLECVDDTADDSAKSAAAYNTISPNDDITPPPTPEDMQRRVASAKTKTEFLSFFLTRISTLQGAGHDMKTIGSAMNTLALAIAEKSHDPANSGKAFKLLDPETDKNLRSAKEMLLCEAIKSKKIHAGGYDSDFAFAIQMNAADDISEVSDFSCHPFS